VNDSTLVTQSCEIAFALWVTCKSGVFGDGIGGVMGSFGGGGSEWCEIFKFFVTNSVIF